MSAEALTLREAADAVGVSVTTLRRRIRAGDLVAYQLGEHTSPLLVDRAELARWALANGHPDPLAERTSAVLSPEVEAEIRRIVREEIERHEKDRRSA